MFKDIKPGDLVLAPVRVTIGWKYQNYLISCTVGRTTANQIIVGSTRYRKSDGREIGGSGLARHAYPMSRTDKNQTAEYEVAAERVKAINVISRVADDLAVLTRNDRLKDIKAGKIRKAAEFMRQAVEVLQDD